MHRLLLQLVVFLLPLAQIGRGHRPFHSHETHLQRWGADGPALDHEHVAGGDLLQVLVVLGVQVDDICKPILLGCKLRFEDLCTSTKSKSLEAPYLFLDIDSSECAFFQNLFCVCVFSDKQKH